MDRNGKMHQQLESPLNTPKFKKDLDQEARGNLQRSGKGQLSKAERLAKENAKAERASYKLNARDKF